MASKVIRDPVHNHIYIDRTRDKIVLDLLDCPEIQRLRRIRQLGVSYLTYPGAEHSRFSHALGVCHLMMKALRYIQENHDQGEVPIDELHRTAIVAAALLHDIGHGPFSHLLEDEFGAKHEKWTIRIIESPETHVHRLLAKRDRNLPRLVRDMILPDRKDVPWLRALLSSQLDVDRMDYLLRDSHFCGVGYGRFDHDYIFHTMRVRPIPPDGRRQPVWLEKAVRVIEEHLFARYYMYWNVYYHRTTRGYEELVRAICQRAKQVLHDGGTLPGTPTVLRFIRGEQLSVEEFVSLDDAVLTAHFVEWQTGEPVLADLCSRFLNRRGLKPVDAPETEDQSMLANTQRIDAIRGLLRDKGLDPTYYLRESAPSAKAYDYYHPEKDTEQRTPENSILIEAGPSNYAEISTLPGMERLRAVTGKRERRRCYYVPDEFREQTKQLLRQT